MSRFINPFVDRGFKLLFGQEVNKELLIDFLNDLLEGERSIEDLTFLNVEMPAETVEGRGAVFDVKCNDKNGNTFIVEVQNSPQSYFKDRGLYYLSRAISNQGQKGGEWQFTLYPVYGIFFLNFKTAGSVKLRTDVILADRETGLQFNEKLRQIYLEMPYFTKDEEACETNFERWLYVLKNMDKLDRMPFKGQKALFEKLEKMAGISNMTQEQRLQYEESLKLYRDCKNVTDYAMEQGKEKGVEKVATQMKLHGLDIDLIASCTGLSPEQIEALAPLPPSDAGN